MFTLGCDPEFFLYDKNSKKIRNAEHFIQGNKEQSFLLQEGYSCLVDGVTAEINLKPAYSKQEFIDNVLTAKMLTELVLPEGFKLLEITTAKLDKNELTKNSRIVGCDIDYNLYKNQENKIPVIKNYFFAGGHIHIGGDFNEFQLLNMIRFLDKNLLPFVNLLEDKYPCSLEQGFRKKVQYGKKGNYRPKFYGIEYRSISNKWTVNDIEIGNVYDIVNDYVKTLHQTSILTF